jgi:hypothetical protein
MWRCARDNAAGEQSLRAGEDALAAIKDFLVKAAKERDYRMKGRLEDNDQIA